MSALSSRHALCSLLLASLAGCMPSDFDRRGKLEPDAQSTSEPSASLDGGHRAFDGSRPAVDDARDGASATPGRLDASEVLADARARANEAGHAGDAAGAEGGSEPGDECAPKLKRALRADLKAVQFARLERPRVFKNSVLGPSQRRGDGRMRWIVTASQLVDTLPDPTSAPDHYPLLAFSDLTGPWTQAEQLGQRFRLDELSSDSAPAASLIALQGDETPFGDAFSPLSLISPADGVRGSNAFILQARNFESHAVWLADVDDETRLAKRREAPLFTRAPFFAHAARIDADKVTVYACDDPSDAYDVADCVAGQVPVDKLADASAYKVYTRDAAGMWSWSEDLSRGTPVLEDVFGQLSVTYNNYLGQYLAVYGNKFGSHAVLRTAERPEGPWSEPVRVALPSPSAGELLFFVREHAPLAQRCERRIILSYYAPTKLHPDNKLAIEGDALLAAIDLD